jgi:hypothetical protein
MCLEQIAWAAGFFEGEGTILLSGESLHVRIGNTDKEIIHRFADILEVGAIYGPYPPYGGTSHRRKDLWVWIARDEAGLDAIALMWPWLGSRRRNRAQALTGVRFHVFSRVARKLQTRQYDAQSPRPEAAA